MHLGSIVPIEKVSLSLFILILSEIKSKWKRVQYTYDQNEFFIFVSSSRSGSNCPVIVTITYGSYPESGPEATGSGPEAIGSVDYRIGGSRPSSGS